MLYDVETTKMLEDAFTQQHRSLTLTHGFFSRSPSGHTIDFHQMVQINNSTGYSREIKRECKVVMVFNSPPAQRRPTLGPKDVKVTAPTDTRMIKLDQEKLGKTL